MAKNRRPEAEPQPASSSEDEEEESSSEESEEEQDTTSTPISKKAPAPEKPEPTPQSSDDDDSESESESESESDSPPNTTRRPDPNIKPITSKPMQDTPKSTKKSRSEPTSATPASKPGAAVKRPAAESENIGGDRDSKRAKKKKKDMALVNDETTPKKNGEDSSSRKQLFQRLWSKDDEIVILKGLIDYREKKGADPMADLNAFQEFIKKSLLHMGDVSKSQFSTKVRRLKKKYQNNVKRATNGQDRSFSNPHEQMSYDLSKKIWGSEANNGVEVDNGKGSTGKVKKNQKVLPKVDELGSPDGVKEGTREEVELNTSAKRALRFDASIGGSSLEAILEDGLELIDGTKKSELEEKWRQFRVEEVELHIKRLDLVREQAKLLLETLKSKQY
ncbi:hypothetical protein Vadar_031710 [Vaccinium darrowii]|uniref:Uncharacterized protein n=1 Tax=Vaccinium darrowii TaxID=229202 RepID=A0ACB7XE86_9ERIC|nr:hypothetical protein Vadar_031710 [Vaccinium darrowii]